MLHSGEVWLYRDDRDDSLVWSTSVLHAMKMRCATPPRTNTGHNIWGRTHSRNKPFQISSEEQSAKRNLHVYPTCLTVRWPK